jgi:hypothetical protein
MWTVVKATERDGVTPKDGDIGSRLARTGVDKRFGLLLYYPKTIEELMDANKMKLHDPKDRDYIMTTSNIKEVLQEKSPNGQVIVTTRNTMYFLKYVPN